jgi:hypothetical protein
MRSEEAGALRETAPSAGRYLTSAGKPLDG